VVHVLASRISASASVGTALQGVPGSTAWPVSASRCAGVFVNLAWWFRGAAPKQTEKKCDGADIRTGHRLGTMAVMSNSFRKGASP
jgi:hypothetical protein